jgi:hypothetical protein
MLKPSFKLILLAGLTSTILLSGCNKLGYGEVRTSPDGQARLGPKRMPQQNQEEIQKLQQAQQSRLPAQQMQPAQAMPPMAAAPVAPVPMAVTPAPVTVAPQQMQPMPPQIPANYPVTPVQPSVTPYGGGSQSYQPQQQSQMQPEPESYIGQVAQQSAYQLPQQYAAGSYYQTPQAGAEPIQNVSANPMDYYTQDMLQNPVPVIVQQANQQQWYAPSAPVPAVQGRNLPVATPQNFQAGYGMEAAYGRYPAQVPAQVPQQQSSYQPMTQRQAELYPSMDPYADELNQPEYNNFYYGGQGMPQGQPQDGGRFSPNFEAADSGQAMTNGFGGRASGMINPVSQEQYLGESLRRPLEEPPLLNQQTQLPNPNTHSNVYYGGQY